MSHNVSNKYCYSPYNIVDTLSYSAYNFNYSQVKEALCEPWARL